MQESAYWSGLCRERVSRGYPVAGGPKCYLAELKCLRWDWCFLWGVWHKSFLKLMHRIFIKFCFYTNALYSNSNFLLNSEQFWVLSLSHHGGAQRLTKCKNTGSVWPSECGCLRVWGNLGSFGLFQTMEFTAEGIHICSSWKKKLQQNKGFLIIKYTRFTLFRSGYKGSPKFKNPKNCTASCTY